MSDFVDQCRREWKRLGVPDSIAAEMAADLASDIREAEADGISVEELLGSSASDPRAFAASWATERGIVGVSPNGAPPQPDKSVLWWSPAGRGFGAGTGRGGAGSALVEVGADRGRLRSNLDPGPEGPALNRLKRLVAA